MVPKSHGRWLWVLLAAFLLRVVAQPVAGLTGWRALPAFGAWQSGALPYRWLLVSQVVLAAWMARTAGRVTSGGERTSSARGQWLAVAAAAYGAVMVVRLALGLTALRGHWWFDAPLPTLFHLVLAAYLGVYADYHLRGHVAPSVLS
jgi:hypothetical protein